MCEISTKMSQHALAKGSQLPPLQPNLIRLFNMRFCPYAQRTRMVLLYKNVPHEVINVNLKYKPKWFLERNPHGLVPILEFNKSVLYESSICDDFLDEVYPHPKLTSNCPFKRAQDKILMFNYDKMLPNFYKLMTPDEDQRKKGREGIQSMLIHMEKILGDAPYFGGSDLGMVDFHVYPWFERLTALRAITDFDPIKECQLRALQAWQARMESLPSVKQTLLPADWHQQFFISLAQRKPEYDIGLDTTSKL